MSLVVEAFKAADVNYGVEQALEWANGFKFPEEVYRVDLEELREVEYSLSDLIKRRQQNLLPDRLNHQRVKEWLLEDPTDPDRDHLQLLVEGIPIVTDPGFISHHEPPPLRAKYIAASAAVNKMIYEMYEEHLLLLFPTLDLLEHINVQQERLHFSPISWTSKYAKKKGRITSDYSFDDQEGGQINTEWVRNTLKEFYGEIDSESIEDVMQKVLRAADLYGWENVYLFKMDLKGAFNLLFFKPSDAGLMAQPLSNGLTAVCYVGNFGWTGLPFAFNVITRTLCRRCNLRLKGVCEVGMYVDDLVGVCHRKNVQHCLLVVEQTITQLLGPNSVAQEKTVTGTVLDFIGWCIDIDLQRLGIARHNFLKTFYGFMTLERNSHLTIREFQKLASWSSRYSFICRFMKPFSQFLYQATAGYKSLEVQVRIADDVWQVILLWRIFFVLMEVNPSVFTRDINSFRKEAPTWFVNLDASLTGLGWKFYRVSANTDEDGSLVFERTLAFVIGYNTPYHLDGKSKFQNSMEFIAISLVGLILLSLGYTKCSYVLQGDNTSSLSWSDTESFKGGSSFAAALGFILMAMTSGNEIYDREHLAGIQMEHESDPLSRGVDPVDLGYKESEVLRLSHNQVLRDWVGLLNPRSPLDLTSQLVGHWKMYESLLSQLGEEDGGWVGSASANQLRNSRQP
jgi:hypothetical protein